MPFTSTKENVSVRFADEDPTYESGMFEPVSIREVADDAESLRGEFTYAPVYPYFNTVHRP